jgi:hypothetical protein
VSAQQVTIYRLGWPAHIWLGGIESRFSRAGRVGRSCRLSSHSSACGRTYHCLCRALRLCCVLGGSGFVPVFLLPSYSPLTDARLFICTLAPRRAGSELPLISRTTFHESLDKLRWCLIVKMACDIVSLGPSPISPSLIASCSVSAPLSASASNVHP